MGKESRPVVSLQAGYRKRGVKVKYWPFSWPARGCNVLVEILFVFPQVTNEGLP
jgi:hypothetical protein